MTGLVPPDQSGDWRLREMTLMPAMKMGGTFLCPEGSVYVPTECQPTECLVIWERYKETI